MAAQSAPDSLVLGDPHQGAFRAASFLCRLAVGGCCAHASEAITIPFAQHAREQLLSEHRAKKEGDRWIHFLGSNAFIHYPGWGRRGDF